jgi:hypothetical protein
MGITPDERKNDFSADHRPSLSVYKYLSFLELRVAASFCIFKALSAKSIMLPTATGSTINITALIRTDNSRDPLQL